MWAGLWVEVFGTTPGNLLKQMVGLGGLEPPTSPLSGARSSHLSYRPKSKNNFIILAGRPGAAQLQPIRASYRPETQPLLNEAHVWRGRASFRRFFDVAELCFVARQIFSQRAPNTLGVSRADDHAVQQFPLRAVWKNVDKIHRELFQIVVNHHQVAVLPLQFLLVRFDLHLALCWLLLIHCVSLPECRFELTTRHHASLVPPRCLRGAPPLFTKRNRRPIDTGLY